MGIEKIKLAKCNPELVDKQLEELELDTNGSLKMRVARLAKYYEEHADELDIANCSICGADADASLPACPFCGDEGEVAEEEEGDEEGEEDEEEDDGDADDGDGDDGDSDGEVEEVEEEEPETVEEEPMAPAAASVSAKSPKGKGKGKAEEKPKGKAAAPAKGKAAANAPKGKGNGKPSKALAPAPQTAEIVVVDSSALDEQVQVIKEGVISGAVSLRRIGEAATKIIGENLWKQRCDENGVPTFRSFSQFCQAELGMTKVHIYRAMKVAEEFTEDELKALSGRQVRLMLDVPKEQRGELIDAAKRGEAGSKLSDRANALRGKKDLPEPKRAITVAVTQGHTKVKMYKRPSSPGVKIGETDGATPAKKIGDQPWAVLDLSNKVRMMIRVATNPKGEMIADVEFRRAEA